MAPYNGIGNEEDTLGYIYKLVPDKPKGNFFKSVDNDKKILRFTGRFNTRVPEDVDRRFIISFYLADDTISIYEPAQKNSGIIEGKFLQRNRYKNIDNGNAWITPSDMAIGGDVKINGHSFHLMSCDEYTTNYLKEHLIWTGRQQSKDHKHWFIAKEKRMMLETGWKKSEHSSEWPTAAMVIMT